MVRSRVARGRMLRRAVAAVGLAVLMASLAAPATFAGRPGHRERPVTVPVEAPPIEFPADSPCADAVRFENTELHGTTTTFPVARDGSTTIITIGTGESLVTNLRTGAKTSFGGWFNVIVRIAADGSARVDAFGTDFIVWYLEGDPTDIGVGLYRVQGHATEWYAADGSLTRATHHGRVTDLCAKVGA